MLGKPIQKKKKEKISSIYHTLVVSICAEFRLLVLKLMKNKHKNFEG